MQVSKDGRGRRHQKEERSKKSEAKNCSNDDVIGERERETVEASVKEWIPVLLLPQQVACRQQVSVAHLS